MVHNDKSTLDDAYIEERRKLLKALRATLLSAGAAERTQESQVNASSNGEAREFEDDAQKLATLELEGTLESRDTGRLVNIERALRKIDEGTYGISDLSGERIPRERLDAVPEAILTLAEQSALDQRANARRGS
jgi:DnaK suppressor protein